MSIVNVFEPLADHAAPTPRCSAPSASGSTAHSLRRSGARPVNFSGRQLGHCSGVRPGAAVWHDLRLFLTDEGDFVADIRVATRTCVHSELSHVRVTKTLEEALTFFEQYDPRADVPAGFEIDDPALSPVELLAHAAALRYRITDTVTQYRVALGSFLTDLNADR